GWIGNGYMGGPAVGLDRYIYFCGEETGAAGTFDGQGGQAVAIFDGVAHILPELSHFEKENVVVVPNTGNKTVILSTEDAGSLTSKLYRYVAPKDPPASDPLVKNGLVGGKLYVLVASTPGQGESTFHKGDGTLSLSWAEIPDPANKVDPTAPGVTPATNLETTVQGLNSFNFVRIEDEAFDRNQPGTFYFITTGSGAESPANPTSLGRLYRGSIHPADPPAGARLTVLLEGDKGDPLVNPDNIDLNAQGQMLICEDPNSPEHNGGNPTGDAFWAARGNRDASVFLYDTASGALVPVAPIRLATATAATPPSLGNNPGGKGSWEAS